MSEDIRICFVGDSFVNGTGDETALGWVGRLCADAHYLGNAITCYNLGVRRDTTSDIRERWESECSRRLPAGCDGRIVLSCGVNDTVMENGVVRVRLESSHANFRAILNGMGKHEVLAVGPPPVASDSQNRRVEAVSKVFAQEALALGCPYVDLFSPLVCNDSYRDEISNNDGAHPGSRGYATIAGIVSASPGWWFRGMPGLARER